MTETGYTHEDHLRLVGTAAAGVERHRDALAKEEAARDEAILHAFAAKVPASDIAKAAGFKSAKRVYQIRDDARRSAPTRDITLAELAASVGMASDAEKVARFIGALTAHDPRTGLLPQPWTGKGMDVTFTRDEAEGIASEWHRAATDAEGVSYTTGGQDAEVEEIADRTRPTG